MGLDRRRARRQVRNAERKTPKRNTAASNTAKRKAPRSHRGAFFLPVRLAAPRVRRGSIRSGSGAAEAGGVGGDARTGRAFGVGRAGRGIGGALVDRGHGLGVAGADRDALAVADHGGDAVGRHLLAAAEVGGVVDRDHRIAAGRQRGAEHLDLVRTGRAGEIGGAERAVADGAGIDGGVDLHHARQQLEGLALAGGIGLRSGQQAQAERDGGGEQFGADCVVHDVSP